MELIQKILKENRAELIEKLVAKVGLDPEKAQGFLPAALAQLASAVQGGGLDLGSLLGGADLGSLVSKVDAGALASETGIDPAQASAGLDALAPTFLSLLKDKAGSAEDLLSSLGGEQAGGLLGAAGGLAGKLFK